MEVPILVLFIVAVVVVLVTSLFKQVEWNHRVKAVLATVVSVVAAAVSTWATDSFTGENLLEASLVLYGLSQAFYHLIFKGTTPESSLAHVGDNDERA